MKAIEIKHISNVKEVSKLHERLERAMKTLEKKRANAEKFGVADWSNDQHSEWLASVETVNGWIVNKDDVKKNGAWFDLICAENNVEDIQYRLEKAENRLAVVEDEYEAWLREVAKETSCREKEELCKLEFEQEQKEWAKDGITLEIRYAGKTPSGKGFFVVGNNGYTVRSLHCFTLYIDGETIFTSGEFWRAYSVIKNS